MNKVINCKNCGTGFEVTDQDLKFYDRVSPIFGGKKYAIPAPTFCPQCRWQRKLTWRNFLKFYNRKSDLSGAPMISVYSEEKPLKVYTVAEWWSDKWDPLTYGRDFDFNRPFFEQFKELHDAVPKACTNVSNSENSEFTNATYTSKDCYMIAGCIQNESCYYSHILWYSKDCMDMLYSYNCEQCYECVDCDECYNVHYSRESISCSNSYYLIDCRSCQDCFGCVGLNRKQYYIFNKPYSKEEYFKKLPELLDEKNTAGNKAELEKLYYERPKCDMFKRNADNVTGNRIYNSRNMDYCFDMINSEDCKYCFTAGKFKDCYDCVHNGGGLELGYETFLGYGYHLLFTRDSLIPATDLIYCSDCMGTSNCFGCVGLHSKEQYCILNKKYTKEKYEEMVGKIIEHMKKTGEWGEFFPASISPLAYNETTAYDFYPMTKEQVLAKGLKWKDEVKTADMPADLEKGIFKCEVTGKLYKIVPQERKFYEDHKLPIPKKCFDQRHKERMAIRNPRRLWDRKCMKCSTDIKTSYAPERKEIVYCESCYLKEQY